MFYEKELKDFNRQGIRYIIVGGIAFNLLGGFRATADLDILIDLTEDNLSKLVRLLLKHKYKLMQPVNPLDILDKKKKMGLIKLKNMKTLSFLKDNSLNAVDIIFDSPVDFAKAIKSVIKLKVDRMILPVVGIQELMNMKKAAWRPIDQADFAELKVLKKLRK